MDCERLCLGGYDVDHQRNQESWKVVYDRSIKMTANEDEERETLITSFVKNDPCHFFLENMKSV